MSKNDIRIENFRFKKLIINIYWFTKRRYIGGVLKIGKQKKQDYR